MILSTAGLPKGDTAWSCNLDQRGGNDTGVLCAWEAPQGNCSPPVTDKNVTQSACGKIDTGRKPVSTSITPNSSEHLLLEVAIPGIKNPVTPPQVSGCANTWVGPVAQQVIQGHTLGGYVA